MQDLLALVKNNDFSFQLESSNRLQFIILAVSYILFSGRLGRGGLNGI